MRHQRLTMPMLIALSMVLAVFNTSIVQATTFTDSNFVETQYASGFEVPATMGFAPDGRLFIAQQDGIVRVIKNGVLMPIPFIDLDAEDRVERGLTGIAFDPNFAVNRYIYLYYTVKDSPPYNQIIRVVDDNDVALPNSETLIMRLDDLPEVAVAGNHNGGTMKFGIDGKLYVAVGDAGSGFAQNSQDLTNRHGSILRINPDGSIPTDNPFYDTLVGENRAIWAYGLRNPYNGDIQPGTGTFFINDVGQNTWEEINLAQAGANYGWPDTEGETSEPGITGPLYVYPHVEEPGGACAITGGAFYNPDVVLFPQEFVGDYLFMDYCAGWIQRYDPNTDMASEFVTGASRFAVDIETGPDGAVYYVSRDDNAVYRIGYANGTIGAAVTQAPSNASVGVGEQAFFSCEASGTEPISYQWQRDGEDIPGATSAGYLTDVTTVQDDGAQYACVVTNNFGDDTSTAATLTVIDSTAPEAQIQVTLPNSSDNERYEVGKQIQFSGTATDPDETLPDSAFDWRVIFYSDGGQTATTLSDYLDTRSGAITASSQNTIETDVWYRIYLRVTDSSGLTDIVYADVFPLVANFSLDTNVNGLSLQLDGELQQTPFEAQSISGVTRSLIAPATQQYNGQTYEFQSWSNGSEVASIAGPTPPIDASLTANYRAVLSGNLVSNYDFLQGEDGYAFVGSINHAVNNGVLEVNRPDQNTAVFGQVLSGINMMTGTNLAASVDLGNAGNEPKSITFIIADLNDYTTEQNILSCVYTVPPYTQLQTYTLHGMVPVDWQTTVIGIGLEDTTAGNLLVDNIILQESDAQDAPMLACGEPVAANTNLVTNPTFDTDDSGYQYYGAINRTVNNGALEISRVDANNIAIVAQTLADARFTSGSKLQATADLGSTSAETKSVNFILANPNTYPAAGSTVLCLFEVPANAVPDTYILQTVVPADWNTVAVGVQVVDVETGNVIVDNLDVQYVPESSITGTTCIEPQVAATEVEFAGAPVIEGAEIIEAVPLIETAE